MAKQRVLVCDKCRKEETTKEYTMPNGWKEVTIKWSQYSSKKLDLCPECSKAIGIYGSTGTDPKVGEQSTAEQLYDVVAAIVAETKEE